VLVWLAVIVAAVATCITAGAAGGPFPDHPITLVIPTAPGGGADIVARIIAAFGPKYLSQPIESVNIQGGANDSLGAARVAASKPDGYTLLIIGNDPITIVPIMSQVPYSYKSFIPIVQTDTIPIIVVAGPRSPVKSIDELKSYTKAHPNQLTVGISGVGGSPQLAVITVMKALGTNDVRYIPFVSSGPALTAALGGTVDLTIGSVATVFSMVQAGKVTPLFVTTPDPVTQLPKVPGTKALHVSGALSVWRMIFAPVLTPPDIVEQLNTDFGKLLADPDLKAKLFNAGVVEAPNTDIPAMQRQLSAEVGMLRTLIPTLMTKR
jgi:tripartite-type tricarboxylate transporter receptor subunit TctC